MTNRTRPTRRITAQTTAVNRGARRYYDVTIDVSNIDHDFGKDMPVPQSRVSVEHYAPELVVTDSIRYVDEQVQA